MTCIGSFKNIPNESVNTNNTTSCVRNKLSLSMPYHSSFRDDSFLLNIKRNTEFRDVTKTAKRKVSKYKFQKIKWFMIHTTISSGIKANFTCNFLVLWIQGLLIRWTIIKAIKSYQQHWKAAISSIKTFPRRVSNNVMRIIKNNLNHWDKNCQGRVISSWKFDLFIVLDPKEEGT